VRVTCGAILALLLCGCAIHPILEPANDRPFDFKRDTFAYANELEWDYRTDFVTGTTATSARETPPTYSRHCIVMARTARQFFQFAHFDPAAPVADDETYRALIQRVIEHSPSEPLPDSGRIVIPGFADLRSFSAAREHLLKDEIGSWMGSYFQLGNWRIVFPFTRRHQETTAEALAREIQLHRPPVVHLVRFPRITINHGVLIYGVTETADEIRFDTYDPNEPDDPTILVFDRASRSFRFPPNRYFGGGPLDVYEIYRDGVY
jgi:hypothetical protein